MSKTTSPSVLIVQLSKRFGGADVRVLDTARALHKQGWHYRVATLGQSPLWEKLVAEGLNVLPLSYRRADPRHGWALVKAIHKEGLTVVDAHNPQSQVWGALAAWWAGVQVRVATVHTVYRVAHVGKGRWHELALWLGKWMGCRFVVVSASIRDYLQSLGVAEGRILLSYNGLEEMPAFSPNPNPNLNPTPTLTPIRTQLNWQDNPLIIVVARLAPVKGHTFLFQALADIRQRHPQVRCLLVGDGQNRAELEAEVATRGLTDMVHFAGFRQDVPALLATADLFCLPSLAEGFPYAIIEATQHGLPLIISNVDGPREHLTDGVHAMLPEAGDVPALVDAICTCIENPQLAQELGTNAQNFVRARFDPEKMVKETLAVYSGGR